MDWAISEPEAATNFVHDDVLVKERLAAASDCGNPPDCWIDDSVEELETADPRAHRHVSAARRCGYGASGRKIKTWPAEAALIRHPEE